MNSHVLNKLGFKNITIKEDNEDTLPDVLNSIDVSVVQPSDHKNPQLVFKLSRNILTRMKWEITDRVSLMANHQDKTIALIKAKKNEKNTFAISTQGATITVAKQTKRGGVVKIGWREELCEAILNKGTFKTSMEIFGDTIIVKLPEDIFTEIEDKA